MLYYYDEFAKIMYITQCNTVTRMALWSMLHFFILHNKTSYHNYTTANLNKKKVIQ